jgi:hypothetical protein
MQAILKEAAKETAPDRQAFQQFMWQAVGRKAPKKP